MTDTADPASSLAITLRGEPWRSKCFCPTTSSSDRGRMRTASGAVAADEAWNWDTLQCYRAPPTIMLREVHCGIVEGSI